MADRQIIVSGANGNGQCLLPVAQNIAVPTLASLDWLDGDRHVVRVAAGNGFTVVLDDQAHVYAAGANGYGTLINSCAGCLGEFACVVFLLGGLGPTPYQFLIASCSCRPHDFSATMPVFTCSLCDRIVREARSYHCPHCDYVVCTDCAHRFRAELSLREE